MSLKRKFCIKRLPNQIVRATLTAAVIPCSLLILINCGNPEPKYDGLPLKVWAERLDSPDPLVRGDALDVLVGVGAPVKKIEMRLRYLARNKSELPENRMKAVNALKNAGLNILEFEDFISLFNAPIIPVEETDDSEILYGGKPDEETETLEHISGADDIRYLEELLSDTSDEQGDDSVVMPLEEEAQEQWVEQRRADEINRLLTTLRDPHNLIELLKMGNLSERRFAARALAEQGGVDELVVTALKNALAEPDTAIRNAARAALQHWSTP